MQLQCVYQANILEQAYECFKVIYNATDIMQRESIRLSLLRADLIGSVILNTPMISVDDIRPCFIVNQTSNSLLNQ